MPVKIEQITKPVILGEGPHWDEGKQVLYFVSIFDKSIHKYDPSTNVETRAYLREYYHKFV
jgi:gluconolactonase